MGRVLNIFRKAFASFVKSSHKPCNNNDNKKTGMFILVSLMKQMRPTYFFFSFFFDPPIQSFLPPFHAIVPLSDNPFGQPRVYSSKFVSIVTHNYMFLHTLHLASQVAQVIKNPPANAGGIRDEGSIPGLGRSPGGGHGNPFQYSCLENTMDRGAWQATVQRVAQSWTWLKPLSTQHAHSTQYMGICHFTHISGSCFLILQHAMESPPRHLVLL